MPTDIEIARSVTPLPITEVAKNAGVDVKHLIPYGFDKAKVDYSLLNEPTDHQAKLAFGFTVLQSLSIFFIFR